jgi:hypothetical protein
MGGRLNYVPLDIQIICSPDLREREFFMRWQDLIGGLHRNPNLNAIKKEINLTLVIMMIMFVKKALRFIN